MRASAPRGRARRARGDGRVPNLGIYRIIRRISRAGGGLMARQEGGGGGISPYGRRRQRMAVGSEGGAAGGGGGLGSMRLGWGERAADTPVSAAPVPPARQTGWSSPPRGGEGGSLGKQAEVGTRASHRTSSPPTDGRGPGRTRGMNTGLRCDCTTHINWQARRPSVRKARRSKGGAGGVVVAIHFSGQDRLTNRSSLAVDLRCAVAAHVEPGTGAWKQATSVTPPRRARLRGRGPARKCAHATTAVFDARHRKRGEASSWWGLGAEWRPRATHPPPLVRGGGRWGEGHRMPLQRLFRGFHVTTVGDGILAKRVRRRRRR